MSHAWYIYMKYVRSVWFSQAINRIMNTDCMQKKIVNVTQNETAKNKNKNKNKK